VVASGNLEVLLERVIPGAECEVEVAFIEVENSWNDLSFGKTQ